MIVLTELLSIVHTCIVEGGKIFQINVISHVFCIIITVIDKQKIYSIYLIMMHIWNMDQLHFLVLIFLIQNIH